jgi:hypothetical protein
VPWHALDALSALLGEPLPRYGLPGPDARTAWEIIREAVEDVIRPGYLDGWATAYQRDGLGFALARYGALLHHPTGSGKTWTAIAWAVAVPGPAVIVTRAATRTQYAREVERFTRWAAFPVKPAAEVRKRDRWQTLAEYVAWCADKGQDPIVVVGWESLPDVVDDLLALRLRRSRRPRARTRRLRQARPGVSRRGGGAGPPPQRRGERRPARRSLHAPARHDGHADPRPRARLVGPA